MIDIQKLKQFPLSYRMLEKYSDKRFGTTLAIFMDKLTNEELVRFLDENKIFVYTVLTLGDNVRFYWAVKTINPSNITELNREDGIETRESATSKSILKAFELLETKLKTN